MASFNSSRASTSVKSDESIALKIWRSNVLCSLEASRKSVMLLPMRTSLVSKASFNVWFFEAAIALATLLRWRLDSNIKNCFLLPSPTDSQKSPRRTNGKYGEIFSSPSYMVRITLSRFFLSASAMFSCSTCLSNRSE